MGQDGLIPRKDYLIKVGGCQTEVIYRCEYKFLYLGRYEIMSKFFGSESSKLSKLTEKAIPQQAQAQNGVQ